MALRQLHTAEIMFIDNGITDGSAFPPSADAVHDAISASTVTDAHIAEVAQSAVTVPTESQIKAYVYEKIIMSANDKTYEVTIDAEGALKVTEQEAEA